MENLKILVTADINKEDLKVFEGHTIEYAGYFLDYNVLEQEKLIEKVRDKNVIISEYDTIDRRVMENAPHLKLIICCRGGVSSVIDLAAAKERGIMVCNTPGRNANSVSDMTVGLLIDITRNISKANSLIFNRTITSDASGKPDEYKDVVWGLDANSPFIKFRGFPLNGKTLGLVGFGAIGQSVAHKIVPFGVKVVAYDPFFTNQKDFENVEFVNNLDELLQQSDFVSLHCAVTKETEGMFNAETFAKMRDGSYFINTARGALVVEEDLVAALESGKLGGAALDVTVAEPIANDNLLLDAKNLVLTPHISGASVEVKDEGTKMVVENLKAFLEGVTPKYCVNC